MSLWYVILQHGSLECLYGHLSMILVNEHDEVQAGDVVAISGNTGKSTGPHLHLRLRKDGKSVDPKPFITYLNDYIGDLQDRIASVKFGDKPDRKLNISNLAEVLEAYHVKYPRIVIAQALLETGYFTSRVCWEGSAGSARTFSACVAQAMAVITGSTIGKKVSKPTVTTFSTSIREVITSSSLTGSAMQKTRPTR